MRSNHSLMVSVTAIVTLVVIGLTLALQGVSSIIAYTVRGRNDLSEEEQGLLHASVVISWVALGIVLIAFLIQTATGGVHTLKTAIKSGVEKVQDSRMRMNNPDVYDLRKPTG